MSKKALVLLLGLFLCLTNGFADEVPEPILEFRIPEGDAYIQGTENIKRAPNFIFGEPDYEKMRDLPKESQDYQLGRKVAYLFTPIEPGVPFGFICTGFLVGPDLLMTNHHCVHDDFSRPYPLELMEIYMDYYQDPWDDPTRGGVTAGVIAIVKADAQLDYALLRLDKPIGNTYGWLELDTTTPTPPGESVKIIHHSSGRSKEISRRNSEIVEVPPDIAARYPFLIAYLADTERGSSGSPIFLRDGTGVIGINHSGWFNRDGPIFNGGSLMSWIVPQIEQYLPQGPAPDLVVEAARINKEFLRPGESFTLFVTVRNQGAFPASTTLRYYRSTDDTISMSDAPIGTDAVNSLPPDGTVEKSITLTAPDYVGTYYYGACVDPAAHETATYNNCSAAVRLSVSDEPPFWIYWTEAGKNSIIRATDDGTHLQLVIKTPGFARGISLDVAGGKMYWTEPSGRQASQIQRANLDGSNFENLITGLNLSGGIALDAASEKMYWTNWGPGQILRANLNGSNVEALVTNLTHSQDIALDVANGKMYWTDSSLHSSGQIQRANLDGSNVETLITGLSGPHAIALDVANGKMYWTVASGPQSGKIQRANLDGSQMEDIIAETVDNPQAYTITGIALDVVGEKMYWTNQSAGRIRRANLDGSNIEDLFVGRGPIDGIALGISISPPPATITLNPSTIVDQTFPINTRITPLVLPVATGGTPPYTYTLSPLPVGLAFTAATRSLSGTPTTAGTTDVTYTATDDTGESAILTFKIEVIEDDPSPDPGPLDVNGDGQVTVMDLVAVALFYGTRVPDGMSLPADVNADGVVNVLDLTTVAQGIDAAGDSIYELSLEEIEAALLAAIDQPVDIEGIAEAPMGLGTSQHVPSIAYRNIADALAEAKHLATSDARFEKGVPAVLEALLHLLAEIGAIPEATALLPNYPNPFNPETWIPYHLSKGTAVMLTIHDVRGVLVRELALGHQAAGVYESRGRAAYWDGRNQLGEPVASGIYFYTLTAGDFTATRKLLIIK